MPTFSAVYGRAGKGELQAQTGFNRRHARTVLEADAQKGRKVISRPFPPRLRRPTEESPRRSGSGDVFSRRRAFVRAAARLLFAAARLLRKQQKQPKTRFRSERWDDAPSNILRRLRYAQRAAILVTRRRVCKQPLPAPPLPIAHLLPEPF